MTDLKVIPFEPAHVDLMELRGIELGGPFSLGDFRERLACVARDSVQAVTFVYDGRILLCAGFSCMWPGVLVVWMIPTTRIGAIPFRVARCLRRYVDRIAKDFGAHRLQTTTHADPMHARWMRFLGFSQEGIMRKFTHDKKDMLMFSRVING